MRLIMLCLISLLFVLPSSAQDDVPAPSGEIAFISDREGGIFQIYVMNGDGSNIRQLTYGTSGSYMPVWSPDGEHIAFVRGLESENSYLSLWVMDADGKNVTEIAHEEDDGYRISYPTRGLAWSPDGEHLLYMRFFAQEEEGDDQPKQLILSRLDGTDSRTLIPDLVYLWDFDFLTDTTLIIDGESHEGDDILHYDLTNEMITPFVEIRIPHEISLSPDKTQLAVYSLLDGLVWVNTATREIHPVQRQLETNIPGEYSAFPLSLSWSADGSHIVGDLYVDEAGETKRSLMFMVRPDGTDYAVFEIELPKLNVPMFSFSADGRYLAYASPDTASGYQITMLRTKGQGETILTTSGSVHSAPIWRPVP